MEIVTHQPSKKKKRKVYLCFLLDLFLPGRRRVCAFDVAHGSQMFSLLIV